MKETPDIKTVFLMGISGLALLLISSALPEDSFELVSNVVRIVGTGLIGYFSVQIFMNVVAWVNEERNKKSIHELFKSQVYLKSKFNRDDLPLFVLTDIEGCITPPNRSEISLEKLQRLRSYMEFTQANSRFPRLVIYTGRSQGYVELLAQSLGMLSFDTEVPCIIENGAALYFPGVKKTLPLLSIDKIKTIREMEFKLMNNFSSNTFEPKSYMVTINPNESESVEDLRQKVTLYLHEKGLDSGLNITNTASAVDITPQGIDKSTGLDAVIRNLYPDEDNKDAILQRVVGIGDHISDLPVLKRIGRPYCPTQNVHSEVRVYVETRTSNKNVIDKQHIDFVIEVLSRECGLTIL
jgi:hydroxymethylpyrimidine pyrophosphatase-like HAD family hydrolase